MILMNHEQSLNKMIIKQYDLIWRIYVFSPLSDHRWDGIYGWKECKKSRQNRIFAVIIIVWKQMINFSFEHDS